MDAPTTTSADGGGPGGDGGSHGWFTPVRRKPTDAEPRDQERHEPEHRHDPEHRDQEHRDDASPRPPHPSPDDANGRTPEPAHRSAAGPAESPRWEPWERPAHLRNAPAPEPDRDDAEPRERTAAGDHDSGRWFRDETAPRPAAEPEPVHEPAGGRGDPAAASPTAPASVFERREASPASPDAILIRRTLAEIEPIADSVTSYFYALLFVQYPDLRSLFPAAMDTQRDRLFRALLTAARNVDNPEVLVDYLANLGRGHRKYGTMPAHYPAVGECLIGALTRYAPESWSAEAEDAWVRVYTTMSQVMIDAADENERHAPAWWEAEVVSHELRTPDVAIVTVRPNQPYPFRAGQYATLETPWWPRVWRHYSFSSAPRSDGLLSFHVRAVPAGWVSNALVHRARPGDVIRLGPPAGSMTVDHTTDNGLLLLGGGTGIAPIKALVEDVVDHGRKRPVEVFYGARTDHDLYDIDTMLRLEQSHTWLSVRPVVSGSRFPEAVRDYGPWNSYDAYLSGPPGMIRSGVDTLVGVGIPSHRIRHDSLEELVAAGHLDASEYE